MTWDWQVNFEVAFDVNPGDAPTDDDWTDLSGRIRSRVETSVGSTRSMRGGSASLDMNNRDRALDPTNPDATYNLVPMRHARLSVTVDIGEGSWFTLDDAVYGKLDSGNVLAPPITIPIWRGYVESWSPVWPGFNQGTVNVSLVDAFTWLSLQDANVSFPAQQAAFRVRALLAAAAWPFGFRDVTRSPTKPLSPYEQDSANLRRVLDDTADAEDGEMYVAPDGSLVFRSRHSRFDVEPVFTVGSSGMPVSSVTPVFDTAMLTNIARVELEGGDAYEVVDDVSVLSYGPRGFFVRDLPLPPAESEVLAQWVVDCYAEPLLWVDQVALEWRDPAVDVSALLLLNVGDLVTFTHTPPGGGIATYVGHAEQVRHVIGRGQARTVLDLSPYFGEGPWLALDDVTSGQLDANKIAP